ncbi:C-reactive protein 1.4-like [Centruroides vittatus]|uniref:C-reactive protein 1.4-like n=1 Tax=Centruroides vittatus TaxID=120091 RepID=UPI00350F6ED4
MFLFLGFLAILCYHQCESSHYKVHIPLSAENFYPRLKLNGTLPNMEEFTLCMWLRPYHFQKEYSCFVSYSTNRLDHEIGGCFFNHSSKMSIGIEVFDVFNTFQCHQVNWYPGGWYHFCSSWFGSNGYIRVFINGNRCKLDDVGNNVAGSIEGGGIFVIGQMQHGSDSGYVEDQAWHGDIVDVNMWNEVLKDGQIREAYKCDGKRERGNIISGMKTSMTALDVILSETELCKS